MSTSVRSSRAASRRGSQAPSRMASRAVSPTRRAAMTVPLLLTDGRCPSNLSQVQEGDELCRVLTSMNDSVNALWEYLASAQDDGFGAALSAVDLMDRLSKLETMRGKLRDMELSTLRDAIANIDPVSTPGPQIQRIFSAFKAVFFPGGKRVPPVYNTSSLRTNKDRFLKYMDENVQQQ